MLCEFGVQQDGSVVHIHESILFKSFSYLGQLEY